MFECERKSVAQHHVEVFRRCLEKVNINIIFRVMVEHSEAFTKHCGLGSTSALAFGIYLGLNRCPFSPEQLRKVLACNYVEESDVPGSSLLQFGYH